MNDATLASGIPFSFRKNPWEKYKIKLKIDDKIRYKKLQYDSNREATKIPSLLLN